MSKGIGKERVLLFDVKYNMTFHLQTSDTFNLHGDLKSVTDYVTGWLSREQ